MENLRIKLRAFDHRVLDKAAQSVVEIAKKTGAKLRGPIPIPTQREQYTVLRSPHVDKKSREQFKREVHIRIIDIIHILPDTQDALMKLDLAVGVDAKVYQMNSNAKG